MRRLWKNLMGKAGKRAQRRSAEGRNGAGGSRSTLAAAEALGGAPRQLFLFPSNGRKKPGKAEVTTPLSPMAVVGGARQSRQRVQQQQRYDAVVVEMKARYRLRVRKWRNDTTGCAWAITYTDGSVSRLIEAPYPRGPVSMAVFLHEVGHHAIGLDTVRPRCLEEYRAWQWSLVQMEAHGFEVTQRVRTRVVEALHYAVSKAGRRGLKRLPIELAGFADRRCSQSATRIDGLIACMMADAGARESRVG